MQLQRSFRVITWSHSRPSNVNLRCPAPVIKRRFQASGSNVRLQSPKSGSQFETPAPQSKIWFQTPAQNSKVRLKSPAPNSKVRLHNLKSGSKLRPKIRKVRLNSPAPNSKVWLHNLKSGSNLLPKIRKSGSIVRLPTRKSGSTTEAQISGTVPANRSTTIPNDSGSTIKNPVPKSGPTSKTFGYQARACPRTHCLSHESAAMFVTRRYHTWCTLVTALHISSWNRAAHLVHLDHISKIVGNQRLVGNLDLCFLVFDLAGFGINCEVVFQTIHVLLLTPPTHPNLVL